MNIFITGIAGCLGSNLADRFLEMGHTVSGIDNFATGSEDYIANQKALIFLRAQLQISIFLSMP